MTQSEKCPHCASERRPGNYAPFVMQYTCGLWVYTDGTESDRPSTCKEREELTTLRQANAALREQVEKAEAASATNRTVAETWERLHKQVCQECLAVASDLTALRERLAEVERERDAWKAEQARTINTISGAPRDVSEKIADDIIARLTNWKEKQPPTGRLYITWPLDREGIEILIRHTFEAAVQKRLSTLQAREGKMRDCLEAWATAWHRIESTLGEGSRKGRPMDVVPKRTWLWMMQAVDEAQKLAAALTPAGKEGE